MKTMGKWAAPMLALSLVTIGCDKKEDAPTPSAAKEEVKEGAAAEKKEAKAASKKVTEVPAAEHLPADCSAVVTADFASAMKDKLVDQHLVQPIDSNLARILKEPGDGEKEKEMKQTLDLLGIKSIKQLHTMAICLGNMNLQSGQPESWGVIVGGEIGIATGWIDVATKFITSDDKKKISKVKIGGVDVLKESKDNSLLAQAETGALVVASDEKMMEKILKKSDAYKKYNLHLEHQLSVVVTEKLASDLMHQAKGSPLEALHPGTFTLSGSVNGHFDGHITMPSDKEATDAASALTALAGQMAQQPDPAAQAILKSLKFKAEGKDLKMSMEVPKEMVAGGIQQLGKQLEAEIAKSKGGAAKK